MKDIQTRGNCPCCGKEQAVMADGRMSQHGYTVDNGWFNGVCTGHMYEPMQIQRAVTDSIVEAVRQQAADLLTDADDLQNGKRQLAFISKGFGRHPVQIAWADASEYDQKNAVKHEVYSMQSRARAGEMFASQMEELVNVKLGTALIIVTKAAAPEQIMSGESRKNDGGREGCKVLTVRRVEGARVYWKSESGMKGWTGTQAWRKLEKVA